MPTLEANYSLYLGYPTHEFADFCDLNPYKTIAVCRKIPAAVKAHSD